MYTTCIFPKISSYAWWMAVTEVWCSPPMAMVGEKGGDSSVKDAD
jgi:hypothetical protein